MRIHWNSRATAPTQMPLGPVRAPGVVRFASFQIARGAREERGVHAASRCIVQAGSIFSAARENGNESGLESWPLLMRCERPLSMNPNGIPAHSPRLRGTSYLGGSWNGILSTPTGLWLLPGQPCHNPVGVGLRACSCPRVARASQPWAGGHNPFGIAETGNTPISA